MCCWSNLDSTARWSEEVLLDIERDLVAKFKIEDHDFDKHTKDQIDEILKVNKVHYTAI